MPNAEDSKHRCPRCELRFDDVVERNRHYASAHAIHHVSSSTSGSPVGGQRGWWAVGGVLLLLALVGAVVGGESDSGSGYDRFDDEPCAAYDQTADPQALRDCGDLIEGDFP